jgi:hypothetical protein
MSLSTLSMRALLKKNAMVCLALVIYFNRLPAGSWAESYAGRQHGVTAAFRCVSRG